MSEFQTTNRARVQILNQPRGRLKLANMLPLAAWSILLLSACSDSTPLATEPEAPDTTPVQPVTQESPSTDRQPDLSGIAEDDHTHTEQTIRFTDSNVDIWPPQPVGITNLVTITDIKTQSDRKTILSASKADSTIDKFMSDRYEILALRPVRINAEQNKYGRTKDSQSTDNLGESSDSSLVSSKVFDYDKNQLITIEFDPATAEVFRHSMNEAQDYQPPESPAEVLHAIELASSSLTQQGFTEHTTLTGSGLLAHPSTAESAASGIKYFNQRKIYVTFGTGNGELPRYRALVNLSTNTVESSGSIQ